MIYPISILHCISTIYAKRRLAKIDNFEKTRKAAGDGYPTKYPYPEEVVSHPPDRKRLYV